MSVPSQRELHEALRRFYEQYASEEDEEEEEAESDEEEEISRFPPHGACSGVFSCCLTKTPRVCGPGFLQSPQRHTMEHIVDFVCCAPMVQILDALVPQTVEQLQDVLQFFDRLSTVPEQVIEVPKILPEDVPMRAVLRATQLAEQLVEVPTIISNPLLMLLDSGKQRIVEQNVDIPAVGDSGIGGGLSGFVTGHNCSMIAEQIVHNPVPRPGGAGGLQSFHRGQGSTAFSEQIAEFPDPGGGRQDFQPVQGSATSSQILLDKLVKGFFSLFPTGKKCEDPAHPGVGTGCRVELMDAVSLAGVSMVAQHGVCGVFSLLLRGKSGASWSAPLIYPLTQCF